MAVHVGLFTRADEVVELTVEGRNGTCTGVRVVNMRTKLSLAGLWRAEEKAEWMACAWRMVLTSAEARHGGQRGEINSLSDQQQDSHAHHLRALAA